MSEVVTKKPNRKTNNQREVEQFNIIRIDPNSKEWKEKIQDLEKRCKENQRFTEVNLKNSIKRAKK